MFCVRVIAGQDFDSHKFLGVALVSNLFFYISIDFLFERKDTNLNILDVGPNYWFWLPNPKLLGRGFRFWNDRSIDGVKRPNAIRKIPHSGNPTSFIGDREGEENDILARRVNTQARLFAVALAMHSS